MSQEAQLQGALEEAWAELERKQTYLQAATDSANQLKLELEQAKAVAEITAANHLALESQSSDTQASELALNGSLQEAWAELDRKQKFLENSELEIRARDLELDTLRKQIAETPAPRPQSPGGLAPDMQAALEAAWADLETRDLEILALKAKAVSLNERIDWLQLENKALSNAVGFDKLRQ